jgi:hypothetical protein
MYARDTYQTQPIIQGIQYIPHWIPLYNYQGQFIQYYPAYVPTPVVYALPQPPMPEIHKQVDRFFSKVIEERSKKTLPETLTDKVKKSSLVQEFLKKQATSNDTPTASANSAPIEHNYSQTVLLKKIEALIGASFLDEGYCHGMTVLWLTMMSLNLEPLFYAMIKDIADCPDDQIHLVSEQILQLLEWIDLAHNSNQYSNDVTYRDIGKIIDNTANANFKHDVNLVSASEMVLRLATADRLVSVTGRTSAYSRGHTVGLFFRPAADQTGGTYSVFDANYTTGKPKEFKYANDAACEINQCIFLDANAKLDISKKTYQWELSVANRPSPVAQCQKMDEEKVESPRAKTI